MTQVNPILSFIESYWKILLIFAIYWQIVIILKQYGVLDRFNIDNHGPLLLIRTTKGQKFLDWLAGIKWFWRIFADIGIPLMLIGMLLMFALIIFSDIALFSSLQQQTMPPPSELHELRNIFLIPGINEFIPIIWGIIGLIVTLIVHEFSHAILCKVEDIRVKSMGLIMVLVPIGGFAEPDETQLFGKIDDKTEEKEQDIEPVTKIADSRQRVRILSAGVMANFVTAFMAFALFFIVIGNIAPVSNVMITSVIPDSPADNAGLTDFILLTHVNDRKIENATEFYSFLDSLPPDENVRLRIKKEGTFETIDLTPDPAQHGTVSGVKIEDIFPGMPSEEAGLMSGMLIIRIDDVPIHDVEDFSKFMENTTPNQKITIHTLFASEEINYTVTLTDHPAGENKGYIGISSSTAVLSRSIGVSVGEFPAEELLHFLKMIPSMMKSVAGWIILLVLPFPNPFVGSFQGFGSTLSIFYEPVGWAAPFGNGIFWVANSLLWIGWLNFYVGLFNCLPMLPLDGGHVFKDAVYSVLKRLFGNEKHMEEISRKIATGFALLILISLIFMIVAPYLPQV